MLERPAVSDEALLTAARACFGLPVVSAEFMPLGCDTASWSFRLLDADGRAYYAKLRAGPLNQVGLGLPDWLVSRGVSCVIPPLHTVDGSLAAPCGDMALIVYPFVDGCSSPALTDEQWQAFGRALSALHQTRLPAELLLLVRRETYQPACLAQIGQLDVFIASFDGSDAIGRALGNAWRAHRQQIMALRASLERLARLLEQRQPQAVLCHADAHAGNLLLGQDGRLWLVDWDEAMLAPRECDLMFGLSGEGASALAHQRAEAFLEGYGAVQVDGAALAYYRHLRAATDVTEFAATALLRPTVGTEDRRAALDWFTRQFAPGEAVELARSSPGARL